MNEPPIFDSYPAGLLLLESTPVGTVVFTLKGHDPEKLDVKYGIQLTDKFVVDPRTGNMSLAKPLDREVIRQFFSLRDVNKNVNVNLTCLEILYLKFFI